MNFVKEVYTLVNECNDTCRDLASEIRKTERRDDIVEKKKKEIIDDLKNQRENLISDTKQSLRTLKATFKAAAEKASIITPDMNNGDAAILQSGVVLTGDQFENIISRNKTNPFILTLARKYFNEHPDLIASMPPTYEKAIENFDNFADAAYHVVGDDPLSLRSAHLFSGAYDPAGADLVEHITIDASGDAE